MYLSREAILSDEYEDEPDLGLSPGDHNSRFASLSSESSHTRHAVAAAEIYPPYGQPQVVRDSHALRDRVAALEQFQSAKFAQLQHKLRYQKAQIAAATLTATNIQVEIGTEMLRIHHRVTALEKPASAASSFSASRQY
ncbi:hypothetical protein PC121_g16071 [Phytophthora cactorum]|nr:hypothetical protein PC120_g15088 [Phytophthora cactorum]KAG3054893.1 hypothetical protein PC121_g16071 [Phytophthora cactorum]